MVSESDSNSTLGLAFTVYPTSSLFPLDDYLKSMNFVVGTPAVGALVANATITNLSNPVVITLPIIVDTEASPCIFNS